MNEQQYYKWKTDTHDALVISGIYGEIEAQIIVDWFDSIKGEKERNWFGDDLVDSLTRHWENFEYESFVYKTLTARAWLYADRILKENN